jgi:hypothetical protein
MKMMRYYKNVVWLCLLWVSPLCVSQVITTRVINAEVPSALHRLHLFPKFGVTV